MSRQYLIALGSNVRHPVFGRPEQVIRAALSALDADGLRVCRSGPVLGSAAVGPSRRRYANSAAIVRTRLDPLDLLNLLQATERAFGRRRCGQRWGARVLDLDIVLWRGGRFAAPGLIIPHPEFRRRAFVLAPALAIAACWRDPVTGFTIRQLYTRLTRPRQAPR